MDLLIVTEAESNLRLDKFLADRFPNYSRTYFQSLIDKQLVLVNGELIKKGSKLALGDEIEVEFAITKEIPLTAEPIPLDILYEDPYLLAINKPAGMVVHPAVGNWSGTFVNALLYHCQHLERGDTLRPGIVHRLDKETSGLLLAAKDEMTQRKLVEAFALRRVHKEYLAICLGNPGNRTITGNIGRHPIKRKEMAIVEKGGKEAKTECQTLAHNAQLSFVRLLPYTGRTHQLRVHLQSIQTPILGDSLYGSTAANKKFGAKRQLLHAHLLRFPHPITHKEIELQAPLPQDIGIFIQLLC
jgi:23S rRNA pseudouridine1911/1915/1917 synthase